MKSVCQKEWLHLSNWELKQSIRIDSVACIINGANPKLIAGIAIFLFINKFSFFIDNFVLSPSINFKAKAADRACEIIVANAAPATSILNKYIKIGSKIILVTAPIITVVMAIFESPCTDIKAFNPKVSSINIVPLAYIYIYLLA